VLAGEKSANSFYLPTLVVLQKVHCGDYRDVPSGGRATGYAIESSFAYACGSGVARSNKFEQGAGVVDLGP
jgi:hypothetical protein